MSEFPVTDVPVMMVPLEVSVREPFDKPTDRHREVDVAPRHRALAPGGIR